MTLLQFSVLALVPLLACKSSSDKAAGAQEQAATQASAAASNNAEADDDDDNEAPLKSGPLVKDKRSQYELAADIKSAELKQDEDDRSDALFDIIDDWRGKQYRWTVYYVKAFCSNPERCHIVPFDRGGKDRKIVQGWTPQLKLSKAEWDKIPAGCPDKAPQCLVTFEGTLAKFTLSTQELTALRFEDVTIIATDANM